MSTVQERISVASGDLHTIRHLYTNGQYIRAYKAARSLAPLDEWSGSEACVLAGRIVAQLGASRMSTRHFARAWREDRTHAEATYYYALTVLQYRGPLRAWGFLKRIGTLDHAPGSTRSDWLALHASVLGYLRDFDAAESWLSKAERGMVDHPWLLVERARLYEQEDRYEDALAAARDSMKLKPWYRPGVQAAAHVLQLLDRDEEAVDLLTEAVARLESGLVVAQLAALQFEMRRYADARKSLDRYAELSPLMERSARRWLAGRRSDVAYGCGEIDGAIAFARDSEEPFFVSMAERLEKPDADTRRVLLPVGFVRQHHQTCGPATLTALSRFWGKPAEHLDVADAICYDGTPDHRERSWAEENGWVAREFRVTWDAAVALLDRGIPFTLTTVETQSAHLQAVIGYDARRATLLIRDPTLPYSGEAVGEALLERYRSVGPRGMAMVPREQAGLLDGIELPEASLYDQLHQLQVALRDHQREAAAVVFGALQNEAPGHRLTWHAARLLANYDADPAGILAATEELLKAYPDDANLRLSQLSYLRDLGRRDQRLALSRELCERPASDPLFLRQQAEELVADAREHSTVVRLAQRVLRTRPFDAPALRLLATVEWDARRFENAIELYRFSACLDDKDEWLARCYFNAARHLHREDEAVRFLEGRFRRFASQSAQPARTLYWALSELERTAEAFAVLEEAQPLRPLDGELLLFAAKSYAACGESESATTRLEAARGHCRHGNWLRAAAFLATVRGDLSLSLALWQEVLSAEPSALDANQAVARHLAENDGRAAALQHLAAACERFPHNFALHQAWIGWLREDGPSASEPVVRRLLAIHPTDAWARRELALVLSEQGRHEEAFTELQLASQLEPRSLAEASVRAQVLERAGHRKEAMEAHRDAIRVSVDSDFDIRRLVELCDSRAERIEALAFVEHQLREQVIFGDGLLAFATHARGILEPDELLATFRKAKEVRPDLWHAWSALILALVERGDLDEALEVAQQACSRFALLPRIWLDIASVYRARNDRNGEIESLRRALQISPGWSTAARALSQVFEKNGNYDESRVILERAARFAPLDGSNQGCLADALWHLGQKDQAVVHLTRALRILPGYEWAWSTLSEWSEELERPEIPLALARELAASRAGDSAVWLALARLLTAPEQVDERISAIDRAIALNPREFEPYDMKAEYLASADRFDEAEAACGAAAWGEYHPIALRGRAAWIQARRGDIPGAIARMRSIVAEDPDYYWGWFNLAEWFSTAGTPADYLEAAEAMVRLSPDGPLGFGYRGEARLKLHDTAGAKRDFERAIELAPSYRFAAMSLFDLELADQRLDAAGRMIELLRSRPDEPFSVAREVQYAAAIRSLTGAVDALARLCALPSGESMWPLNAADQAMAAAGWSRDAEAVFEKALDRSDVPTQVVDLWVEHAAANRTDRCAGRIDGLLAKGEIGRRALCSYLGKLGRMRAAVRIRACIRRHRDVLREHPRSWGMAGYALVAVGRYGEAVRWMQDWADRSDCEAWMLNNLNFALRALRKGDEANRASRRALELAADSSTPYHKMWLALDEILAGQAAVASKRIEGLEPTDFGDTEAYIFAVVRLLLSAELSAPETQRRAIAASCGEFMSLTRETSITSDDYGAVEHTYYRVLNHLARLRGGLYGFLWKLNGLMAPPRRQN